MRQGWRPYVDVMLWAGTVAAAAISAAAFADPDHDMRPLAFAAVVVSAGNAVTFAGRALRKARMAPGALAVAWRSALRAERALKAARHLDERAALNTERIGMCESRTQGLLAVMELAGLKDGDSGADAPTSPRGLRLVLPARDEGEAAG